MHFKENQLALVLWSFMLSLKQIKTSNTFAFKRKTNRYNLQFIGSNNNGLTQCTNLKNPTKTLHCMVIIVTMKGERENISHVKYIITYLPKVSPK